MNKEDLSSDERDVLGIGNLHDPNRASPIEASEQQAIKVRELLTEAGYNFDITEAEKTSLTERQFRARPDKQEYGLGRGPGFEAVTGDRADQLVTKCYNLAIEYRWVNSRIGGLEGTQGRGLQQAAADIIGIAVFAEDSERRSQLLLALNQRIRRGLEKANRKNQEALDQIENNYADVLKPNKPKQIASVPPGSLPDLWGYMIDKTQH